MISLEIFMNSVKENRYFSVSFINIFITLTFSLFDSLIVSCHQSLAHLFTVMRGSDYSSQPGVTS